LESGALAHWRFEPSHPDQFNMDTINDFVTVEVSVRESKDSVPALKTTAFIHREDVNEFLNMTWDHDGLMHHFWLDNIPVLNRFRKLPEEDRAKVSHEWYPERF